MKPIRFLHPAQIEMMEAAQYYERQAHGLGGRFLDGIDTVLRDLSRHPLRWPIIHDHIRRRLIPPFPYALLYRDDPDEIVILATMHLHRHPQYWINRQ